MLRVLPVVVLLWATQVSADSLPFDDNALGVFLEEVRVEMALPGLRAAVVLPDGRMAQASVGLGDVEGKIALDDTIGMPGGSTGKTFVAALAMLLVEDGLLSLDDPVAKWLGQTDWYHKLPNSSEMRIRHLLSHTTGLSDYPGRVSFYVKMIWRVFRRGSAYFTPQELIAMSSSNSAPYPPGAGYRYSDTGYLLLGLVIEQASGQAYYDLLQTRIVVPQGLTGIRPQNQSVLTDIAPSYEGGARNLRDDGRMKLDPRTEWTGGGLVTTPAMLARFYAALASGEVVTDASLAQMLNGGWRNPDASGWHYGFGLFVYDEGRAFGHGGSWSGYRTHVLHNVQAGVTVAVQANRAGADVGSLPGLILELVEASR